MGVELFRIDDRLIHGQVVVGWGQPLEIEFIALVDDEVAVSDWEQELYRMGVPPGMDVYFLSVGDAVARLPDLLADTRRGLVLTGEVATMQALAERSGRVEHVNVGGLHHRPGRAEHLRYVFLTAAEVESLREMERAGIEVTAQDLPSTTPVPLSAVLSSRGAA
jgi:PTS system mannose-specific IIB component/fructoselysine and glucoselysine-specific PTS system IIB component